jgi:hypothetical protein
MYGAIPLPQMGEHGEDCTAVELFSLYHADAVTFHEIFGPLAYLEKWSLFLQFSCYNM